MGWRGRRVRRELWREGRREKERGEEREGGADFPKEDM